MAKFFLPDEADQRILKEVVRQFRAGIRNPQQQNVPPTDDPQAPETYIALPPLQGISALSRVGTADIPQEGDTPGSADCEIYKIKSDGTLEKVSTFTQKVYNLSATGIDQEWVQIARDKFGFWIADITVIDPKVKEGVLQSALIPATDATDGETTAILDVYSFPAVGTGGFELTGETIVVTNRLTEIKAIVSGTWLVAVRINAEWRPISADCGATTV